MSQAAANVLRNQGLRAMDQGDLTTAEQQMRAAVAVWPHAPILHLELGQIFELQGLINRATRSYFLAISKARDKGLWLEPSTLAPGLAELVVHAMSFVQLHRADVLHEILQPLTNKFGKTELKRVIQALDIFLEIDLTKPANPLQRPLFLYIPGLREQAYWSSDEFEWAKLAIALQPQIEAEARAVLERRESVVPFLQAPPGESLERYLASTAKTDSADSKAQWEAHFFYRHGEKFEQHLRASPVTAGLLEQINSVRIAAHAPEICFSILAPHTTILPHTGVTNARLVAHLPLILPGNCALKVAGETREWRERELLIFDDTFEHEAWNHAEEARVILLMDTWHPDLSAVEKLAVSELVEGIGIFNRG